MPNGPSYLDDILAKPGGDGVWSVAMTYAFDGPPVPAARTRGPSLLATLIELAVLMLAVVGLAHLIGWT